MACLSVLVFLLLCGPAKPVTAPTEKFELEQQGTSTADSSAVVHGMLHVQWRFT